MTDTKHQNCTLSDSIGNRGKMANIPKGYIIVARRIYDSKVANMPPHCREIWLWLIQKANHKRKKICGRWIERGSMLTSYAEIIERLSWKVGYRKEAYKKHQCETAMKALTKAAMITTTKTTRGFIVTICNYGIYQNPKNYETDSDTDNETCSTPTVNRQDTQELKNGRRKKRKKEDKKVAIFIKPTVQQLAEYGKEINYGGFDPQYFFDWYENNEWKNGKGRPLKNWKLTVRMWKNNRDEKIFQQGRKNKGKFNHENPQQKSNGQKRRQREEDWTGAEHATEI